jgi:hypothetical protein
MLAVKAVTRASGSPARMQEKLMNKMLALLRNLAISSSHSLSLYLNLAAAITDRAITNATFGPEATRIIRRSTITWIPLHGVEYWIEPPP